MVRRLRKGPLLAVLAYAASPGGRQRLRQLRRQLDTPANRRRAMQAKDRLVTSAQRRKR